MKRVYYFLGTIPVKIYYIFVWKATYSLCFRDIYHSRDVSLHSQKKKSRILMRPQ